MIQGVTLSSVCSSCRFRPQEQLSCAKCSV
jgi:hypothetical protein